MQILSVSSEMQGLRLILYGACLGLVICVTTSFPKGPGFECAAMDMFQLSNTTILKDIITQNRRRWSTEEDEYLRDQVARSGKYLV
jgi:hypothetical protein